MKNLLSNPRFHDGIHILVILTGFAIVIFFPFWVGFLLMLGHWLHQRLVGGCLLTKIAKKCGAMKENTTFFTQLMENLHVPKPKKMAKVVDTGVKLSLVSIPTIKLVQQLIIR